MDVDVDVGGVIQNHHAKARSQLLASSEIPPLPPASYHPTIVVQVSEAGAEVEALRRLIKLKTRELRNVRRLAQEVLLQRSDVETFLLSSLHAVR
jgi:hypothetical protein